MFRPSPHHDVSQVLNTLDTSGFDLVVGIGGGSVLDVAKLLSVLVIHSLLGLTRCWRAQNRQRASLHY
jgi:alcohol dehydrogenase class IV